MCRVLTLNDAGLRYSWRRMKEAASPSSTSTVARIPSKTAVRRVQASVIDDFGTATGRLVGGQLSQRQWVEAIHDSLIDGHGLSWSIGRQRAGDMAAFGIDDQLIGLQAADNEQPWLQAFADDVADGRYTLDDGTLNAKAINNRLRLYAGKLRGTANEAFVEASDDGEEFEWVLGLCEHCDDCPDIASMSPYTKEANLGYPGDGGTACLGNCQCHLVRASDGRVGLVA